MNQIVKMIEATPVEAIGAPPGSEQALAMAFADRHAGELRYVAKWGKWLRWDGARWAFDETRQTFTLANRLCREVALAMSKSGSAKTLASAKTRAAVVALAGEEPRLVATFDQWDADPWLLNTPGGVVDLRTGNMRPAKPEDYMTKIAAVTPGGVCPRWRKFLREVTDGDGELANFLMVMAGYCLTGITTEHAFFFLHGDGGNGKGVFLSTVAKILDDYARTAPIETFLSSKHDRHPTELAGLHGARLVTVNETPEGRTWDEAKIKTVTGGDKISARFMRQEFFDFWPQFKLMVSGNHRPSLRTVDEAMRRRLNSIPFTVLIPPEKKDKQLAEKLKPEWPGILAMMIDGCRQWQAEGLKLPQAVTDATDAYLQDEDTMAIWLAECTVKRPDERTPVGELFQVWEEWARARGAFVTPMKRFSQELEVRGYKPHRGNVRAFIGLSLYVEPEDDDRDPRERKRIWAGRTM